MPNITFRYSGYAIIGLVWYSNGWCVSICWMLSIQMIVANSLKTTPVFKWEEHWHFGKHARIYAKIRRCLHFGRKSQFLGCVHFWITTLMADAKRTPSYSLDLHFLDIIMQLSDLWWHFQLDLPKSKICNIGGVQYVRKISLTDIGPRIVWKLINTSRPEDCLKTKKYSFLNIFLDIAALCRVYIIILINVGSRNNRGTRHFDYK